MGLFSRHTRMRPAPSRFPELVPQEDLTPFRFRADPSKTPKAEPEFILPTHELSSEIQGTTLSFANLHQHGNLFVNYLKVRREVFIDMKGWELPQSEGMEFDQYDTPLSRWVVIHEYGRILAGMRLTPTTAQCGQYTYMLRDAQRGLLENIPADVLFVEAPCRDDIWEATRLFVAPSVDGKRRLLVQKILLEYMAASARALGAEAVIGIVPAVFSRWMKRIGMTATPLGPEMNIAGDRTQAALMNVVQPYKDRQQPALRHSA